MKTPDKTYPLSVIGELPASTPPNEVVSMPNKIYFDGVDTSTTPRLAINEEYIRKDALLEWIDIGLATRPITGSSAIAAATKTLLFVKKHINEM